MLRSMLSPVDELAVTVRGNTPLDKVTLALFKFGTNVQVAPAAQLCPANISVAPVLLRRVTWGLAKVMSRLV
jgi:hypothetical protein